MPAGALSSIVSNGPMKDQRSPRPFLTVWSRSCGLTMPSATRRSASASSVLCKRLMMKPSISPRERHRHLIDAIVNFARLSHRFLRRPRRAADLNDAYKMRRINRMADQAARRARQPFSKGGRDRSPCLMKRSPRLWAQGDRAPRKSRVWRPPARGRSPVRIPRHRALQPACRKP